MSSRERVGKGKVGPRNDFSFHCVLEEAARIAETLPDILRMIMFCADMVGASFITADTHEIPTFALITISQNRPRLCICIFSLSTLTDSYTCIEDMPRLSSVTFFDRCFTTSDIKLLHRDQPGSFPHFLRFVVIPIEQNIHNFATRRTGQLALHLLTKTPLDLSSAWLVIKIQ